MERLSDRKDDNLRHEIICMVEQMMKPEQEFVSQSILSEKQPVVGGENKFSLVKIDQHGFSYDREGKI